MTGIRFHPEVAQDVAEAMDWLEERSPRAAERFRKAVDDESLKILKHPGVGHPCGRFRRRNLKRFPYNLIYDISAAGEVWVLVVRHDARHPDHGMDRRIPEDA